MIRVNLHEQIGNRARRMPRWAAWLTMAASLIAGVALFILVASLALILIPIVLIVGTIAVWRLRARLKAAGFGASQPFEQAPTHRTDVIDAEYRIVEPGEPPRR